MRKDDAFVLLAHVGREPHLVGFIAEAAPVAELGFTLLIGERVSLEAIGALYSDFGVGC